MPTLSIVSVPIGDSRDITLRAIEVLRAADVIVCEDLKPARRLLHYLKIEKELLPLNEHTLKTATDEALELLRDGKSVALISDAGTPLISDPGSELVRRAIAEDITVSPIPGASSVLAALVVCGYDTTSFFFAGMLPRDKTERKRHAKQLAARAETIILLEAPYRLSQLLDELTDGFGPKREACVAMDLTLPKERVARGTLFSLREEFRNRPFKGEFVIVLRGNARDARR
jgi:16S rRNA (cytidine1402-2'-O)-methyltransferase